jgi:tetratricopeptide (TPR) repeat protein
VRAHPIIGGGAGSYEAEWNKYRPNDLKVRDAHNLYLETLAELGVVGLVLLVAVLGMPFVAAFWRRRDPLVPFAFGAFTAYLAHAIVDWDWELAGITVTALLIGFACLREAHGSDPRPELQLGRSSSFVGAAAVAAVGGFALLALVGNTAATKADAAVSDGHWKSAARHARQVIRWAPWSSQGWQLLGEAQLAQRQPAAAQRSLRRAAKKDPQNWSVWLELATAETGAARRQALAEAKRLNPRSPEIAQFLKGLG